VGSPEYFRFVAGYFYLSRARNCAQYFINIIKVSHFSIFLRFQRYVTKFADMLTNFYRLRFLIFYTHYQSFAFFHFSSLSTLSYKIR
jgi:hypothetical protein